MSYHCSNTVYLGSRPDEPTVIPSGVRADTKGMNNSKANAANPSARPASWVWAQISNVVPELPCGAITLILLLGKSPESQHERTVQDLVGCMLDQGLPLTYVAVDYAPGGLADKVGPGIVGMGDDNAQAIVDLDHTVVARMGDGSSYPYQCGLPTLEAVDLRLAQEGDGGGRLVILDGFERARPYRAAGDSLIPAHIPLTAEDVDTWRSVDVLDFAQARPLAPTVVVWNGDGIQSNATKMSIGSIADVVVALNVRLNIMTVNTKKPDGDWDYAVLG